MSYLDTDRVQAFLQHTKFNIGGVEEEYESVATIVIGKVTQRYDTSVWLDEDTTPDLILNLMAMLAAAMYLRKVASEEDGLTSYADSLESRVDAICEAIVNGTLVIDGETYNSEFPTGSGPSYFPDETATALYEDNNSRPDGSTWEENAAPRVFGMSQQF